MKPVRRLSSRISKNTSALADNEDTEKTVEMKASLSKYMDDQIKNFDPLTFRSKTKTERKSDALNDSVVEIKSVKSDAARHKKKVKTTSPVTRSNDPLNDSVVEVRPSLAMLKAAQDAVKEEEDEEEDNDTMPLGDLLKEGYLEKLVEESSKRLSKGSKGGNVKESLQSAAIVFATSLIKESFSPQDGKTAVDESFDGATVALPPSDNKENVPALSKEKRPKSKNLSETSALSSDSSATNGVKGKKRVSFGGPNNPLGASKSSVSSPRLSPGGFGGKSGDTAKSLPAAFVAASNEASLVQVNGKTYTRVGILGKGGSSCVYRVLSPDGQLFAYKRVDIRGGDDGENLCESYVNEIKLLQNLKGSPYIIELLDAEVEREQMYIAMVMEVGEIDLAKVLQKQMQLNKKSSGDGSGVSSLSPFFVRMIWQEMLEAVDHIHANRIVHGDLKPANFVFVKGHLKLIDFGIAKAFSNDTTNIYRDSQIGTINYMAPEAISPFESKISSDNESDESFDGDTVALKTKGSSDKSSRSKSSSEEKSGRGKMKMGRASDIWSMGCILYQMLYGRPPFSALSTIQKLQAIPNPNYQVPYPAHDDMYGIETVKACLQRDVASRATIRGESGLLSMRFLQLAPPASSSLQADSGLSQANTTANKSISMEHVSRIIDMVASSVGGLEISAVKSKDLCTQILNMLANASPPKSLEVQAVTKNVEKSPARSGMFDRTKQILATSSSSNNIENQRPFSTNKKPSSANKPSMGPGSGRKPMNALPSSLSEQIQNKFSNLKSVSQSNASHAKWQRQKTPEKPNNMQAALERRLEQMRNFIKAEEVDDSDDSMEITRTGGDFKEIRKVSAASH